MDEAFIKDGFLDVIQHYPNLLIEGMEAWNWGFLVGFFLWLGMLFVPLNNTDRRDIVAGLLFALFGMLAGMCFFFLIPAQSGQPQNHLVYISSMIFFALIFLCRWFWNYRPPLAQIPPIEPEDSVSPKNQEL